MAGGGDDAVSAILDERAARYAGRAMMRIDGVDISFAQLRDRSIADGLRRHDEWFRTGDHARLDADGTLSYLDRNVVGRVRKDVLRAEGLGADAWDREAVGYVVRR